MSLPVGRTILRIALFVSLPLATGCSSSKPGAAVGTPTGSTCPSGSTVTYDGFVKGFMEMHCTRCHSSTLSGSARNGAPLAHDFDSEKGILAVGDHVDERAAAGPDATNELMPPSDPRPSAGDRRKLGEWLACKMAGTDGGSHHMGDAATH
jgi:uncharacterized membrane protein